MNKEKAKKILQNLTLEDVRGALEVQKRVDGEFNSIWDEITEQLPEVKDNKDAKKAFNGVFEMGVRFGVLMTVNVED